jgi:hypothetical protein
MATQKAFVFALIGVSFLSAFVAPAQAGGVRLRLHVSDFYARAPEEPVAAPRVAADAAQGCYVSLSATEVSRGIRHWTNKC